MRTFKIKNCLVFFLVGIFFSSKIIAQNINDYPTDFSCFTYQQLSKAPATNIFFSPVSIQSVLYAIYLGANGQTQKEIGNTLQLPFNNLEANLEILLSAAYNNIQTKEVTLDIANGIWVEKSIPLNAGYKNAIKPFNAEVLNLDFKNYAEASRHQINQSVAKETHNKITELLKPGSLNDLTRMVLTNAVYFQGNWDGKFDKSNNENRNFYTSENSSTSAEFMTRKGDYKHASTDLMQILELPYQGGEVSMVIFLPKAKDGLAAIEQQLSSKTLNQWMHQTGKKEVSVFLPKFKLENNLDLRSCLESMGIQLAFNEDADFSTITSEDIHISKITHQAMLEINETGTEATAATSATFIAKGVHMETPVFMADHPFLFLIRHNESGQILFMGRFADPLEKSVALNDKTPKDELSQEKSGNKISHVVVEGETLYQISRTYGVNADYIALSNKVENNTIFQGQKLIIEEGPEEIFKSAKIKDVPPSYSNVPSAENIKVHSVAQGETLYSIANKYRITVDDLKSYNGLTENELAVGQILKLQKSSLRFLIYTVQQGDTLSYISKKYNKKLEDLMKENNLTSNIIFIGQELRIEL
jgi:serpin B